MPEISAARGEKINGKLLMMMKIEKGRMYLVGEIVKRSTYSVNLKLFPAMGKAIKTEKSFEALWSSLESRQESESE